MMILVTGGSGSGKSAFAEDCVVSFGKTDRIYIATMYPFDEESRKRVQRHRKMRQGKGFETVECYTGLDKIRLPENCTVLLECMSNLVANEMFQEEGAHENTVEAVLKGVRHIREQAGNLVIVTNEIFSEAADYQGETELYQEYLGQINQKIAEIADQVVEVVYGIPVYHKNKLCGTVLRLPLRCFQRYRCPRQTGRKKICVICSVFFRLSVQLSGWSCLAWNGSAVILE